MISLLIKWTDIWGDDLENSASRPSLIFMYEYEPELNTLNHYLIVGYCLSTDTVKFIMITRLKLW